MHYIIDGYNLLFYLFGSSSNDFKTQRENFIRSMNAKIEFLRLDVLVVFDSHLVTGEGSRSHYRHLEIIYTPKGVTADDFIVDYLKRIRQTSKEIVVTNDKELSLRARHLFARTQNVDEFLNLLQRQYSNKRQTKRKPEIIESISSFDRDVSAGLFSGLPSLLPNLPVNSPLPVAPPKSIENPKLIRTPKQEAPEIKKAPEEIEGSTEYYLSVFQASHEAILRMEEAAKIEKKERKKRRNKKSR